MLFLRSLLFQILFFTALAVLSLVSLPLTYLPKPYRYWTPRAFAHVMIFLQRFVAGMGVHIRGQENMIRGPAIVAAKHQSAWETFALWLIVPDPVFVLKAELLAVPVFGQCLKRLGMIAIEREQGAEAADKLVRDAQRALSEGRQIVIFPEGTRRVPGAEPAYKPGVAMLYKSLNVPIVPIALNAGVFWPRRSFWRYKGLIEVEVLPPIEAGLPRGKAYGLLQQSIEGACARLPLTLSPPTT
jgi:1-acyl-sn-glycerol-3-phosphate acyltransferase